MNRRRVHLALAVLLLLVAAVPAVAEYTVKLTNGSRFLTRYPPAAASWDPSIVLVLTDVSNWIAVPREEIEQVVDSEESRGFGLRISTTTISFGYLANDAAPPGEEPVAPPPFTEEPRSYDIQQFVSPGEAGGGGIPVYGVQFTSSGGEGEGGGR